MAALVISGVLALMPVAHAAAAEPAAAPVASVAPASVVDDPRWAAPGPYEVTEKVSPAWTVYRPTDLGAPGTTHPVIIWGNGTGAIPQAYDGLLRHLASHGFIVSAANTINSDTGIEMLAGARELAKENDDPDSPYYHRVDTSAIGAAGHSQGGAGAINAGGDPSVRTVLALQPGPLALPERVHGPTLYLAGQDDHIVNPDLGVIPLYERTKAPAYYAELRGANHFESLPDGGRFVGLITAWFHYQLLGDSTAERDFVGDGCGVCTDPQIVDYRHHG